MRGFKSFGQQFSNMGSTRTTVTTHYFHLQGHNYTLVYVDGIFSLEMITLAFASLKQVLQSSFHIKDLGHLTFSLD